MPRKESLLREGGGGGGEREREVFVCVCGQGGRGGGGGGGGGARKLRGLANGRRIHRDCIVEK